MFRDVAGIRNYVERPQREVRHRGRPPRPRPQLWQGWPEKNRAEWVYWRLVDLFTRRRDWPSFSQRDCVIWLAHKGYSTEAGLVQAKSSTEKELALRYRCDRMEIHRAIQRVEKALEKVGGYARDDLALQVAQLRNKKESLRDCAKQLGKPLTNVWRAEKRARRRF